MHIPESCSLIYTCLYSMHENVATKCFAYFSSPWTTNKSYFFSAPLGRPDQAINFSRRQKLLLWRLAITRESWKSYCSVPSSKCYLAVFKKYFSLFYLDNEPCIFLSWSFSLFLTHTSQKLKVNMKLNMASK